MKTKFISVIFLQTFAFCLCLNSQTRPVSTVSDQAFKEREILFELRDILALPKSPHPEKIKTFTLVKISNTSLERNGINGVSSTIGKGILEIVDPLNTGKALKSIPFNVFKPIGGSSAPIQFFSPFFNKIPSCALCELDGKKILAGEINILPTRTLLIPDEWEADFGKMVSMSNPMDFFNVPKEVPENFHFPTKWALLIYGNDLAAKDFPKFKDQYSDLLSNGDFYTAAYLTDLLLKEAVKNKMDVSSDINNYIDSSAAKPDLIGAIALAMYVNSNIYDKNEIQRVLTLVKQKAKPDSPEWANTLKILDFSQIYKL